MRSTIGQHTNDLSQYTVLSADMYLQVIRLGLLALQLG
jgi:hypothetical protein